MPCAAALGINALLDGTACYGVRHLIYKGIAFSAHRPASPCCLMIPYQPLPIHCRPACFCPDCGQT
jgi:hypothetical protein